LFYIGEILKKYRRRLGLSQEEFAVRLFISKDYLIRLESTGTNTRRPVKLETILRICDTFKDFTLYHDWNQQLNREIEAMELRVKFP